MMQIFHMKILDLAIQHVMAYSGDLIHLVSYRLLGSMQEQAPLRLLD
jgi:hypothetical protein